MVFLRGRDDLFLVDDRKAARGGKAGEENGEPLINSFQKAKQSLGVVLGPIGANFGAGMTGGRAYLYDPTGRHVAALAGESVTATRLSQVLRTRIDGTERFDELFELLQDHAAAGSELAQRLVLSESLAADTWLIEPVTTVQPEATASRAEMESSAIPLRA